MQIEELVGILQVGWTYTTLGAACEHGGGNIQTGPFGSQLHAADYVPRGIPSIMPANIGDNCVVEEGIARITEADASRLSRYLVRAGDIVYSRRGDVERRALIRAAEDGWLCGTGCLRVRLGDNGPDPTFTAYYLGHPAVREWIVRHAHGATMANLNTAILSACPFVVPPPREQVAIATLLGALDDKIELNRQTNQTLEALAQALYRDWFVDFGPTKANVEGVAPYLRQEIWDLFPAQLDSSGRPVHWGSRAVHEIADFVNGAAYKDMHFSADRDGYPVVKIAELKAGVTSTTKFTSTELGERYRIDNGEILLSWSGNPDTSIDAFIWVGGPAWLNQHIFRVRENGKASRAMIYFQLKILRPVFAEIARNKQTTGLGHVTAADMKRLMVCDPPPLVARAYDDIGGPIFQRIVANQVENRTLAAIRDALLPKLMSGAVSIRGAQRVVEAAL